MKDKSYLTMGVLIFLVAVFVVIGTYMTFQSRQNLYDTYLIKSKAQAQLFGQNVSALFKDADLALLSILFIMDSENPFSNKDWSNINNYVTSSTRFLPQISNVAVFNEVGKKLYNLYDFNYKTIPNFRAHKEAWLEVTITSEHTQNDVFNIYLSRRIDDKDNRFSGELLAVLNPDYFRERFEEYLEIDVDAIALIDEDSTVLTYWSHDISKNQEYVGHPVQRTTEFSNIPNHVLGSGGLDVIVNQSHIVSSYQLSGLPFQILVAYNKDRIFNEWFVKARQNFLIIIVFTVVAVVTIVIAILQIQKRKKMAWRLVEYQEHLEELVQARTEKLEAVNKQLEDEIEERALIENQINASLKEKDILLKEVHHRVKNNLAVVSSLLSLQSFKTDDSQVLRMIKDSQNRIHAMSLIHKTLYKSDDLGAINVKNYIGDLVESIRQTYADIDSGVQLKLEVEDQYIDIKIASTLGLIVNELITNSFKYAFPDNRKGEITIQFRSEENGENILTVIDNGIGLPESFELDKSGGLGLSLVKTLAQNQLQGSITVDDKDQTKFEVHFNLDNLELN